MWFLEAPVAVPETVVEAAGGLSGIPTQFQNDPVYLGLAWIIGIVVLLLAIGKPLKDYLRQEKRSDKEDQVDVAKAGAESILYTHLAEQISQYRQIVDTSFKERNDLVKQVADLQSHSREHEYQKALVEKLKSRLDQKDQQLKTLLEQTAEERGRFLMILQGKEQEILRRDERIYKLEQWLKEMETRLAVDEDALKYVFKNNPVGENDDASTLFPNLAARRMEDLSADGAHGSRPVLTGPHESSGVPGDGHCDLHGGWHPSDSAGAVSED